MKRSISKLVVFAASMFIGVGAIPENASAAAGGAGNGVWFLTFQDGSNSCTPISVQPQVSTCDLPWSFTQARTGIVQLHSDGTVGLLLPAIRGYSIGSGGDFQHPASLVLSDFAGKWSHEGINVGNGVGGSPIGDISLVLVSSMAVANWGAPVDRKSTRLNSSHVETSYAVFCL